MERDGQLRLRLKNVYGDPLGERVDVNLRHQTLGDRQRVPDVSASRAFRIKGLLGAPQGLYQVEVEPPSYLPIRHFINLKASGVTDHEMVFPIDPKKIKEVEFPIFGALLGGAQTLLDRSRSVFSFEGKSGEGLFEALGDIRRAGFLNIVGKCERTPLPNGRTVLSYVEELLEIRGDRFFARAPKELREEVKNSVAEDFFQPVSGALHHPPAGYTAAESFKTDDSYGNLQLTFFMNEAGECVADVDIDDAAGIGHVFQVLRNKITGRPTHPYDIHEILVFHQKLDPGYRFVL